MKRNTTHTSEKNDKPVPLQNRHFDVINEGGNLYLETYRNGKISRENLPGWIG